jgi:hypothetical protein
VKYLLMLALVASLSIVGLRALSTYTTHFPATENPISEGGAWTTGASTGLDWSDVRTTPGLAFGTQTGFAGYNDSIAVLNGTWSSDQSATGIVHTTNKQAGDVFEEAEVLLRFAIAPHVARGYELNFSMRSDGAYAQIVRWNGALGDFTLLDARSIPPVNEGDRVSGSIVGSTITTYVNGVEIFHVTDSTFTDGNPGVGFYLQSTTGLNPEDYGFTCYAAAAGGTPPPCVAQTVIGGLNGGGRVLTPSGFVTLAFELRCNPADKRGNLEVNWGGNRFHLENVTAATCFLDPSIVGPVRPGRSHDDGDDDHHGAAKFNTLQGRGTGRYNNAAGASAFWTFTDAGEPGTNDTANIQITDTRNVLVLTASGRLINGNFERHSD